MFISPCRRRTQKSSHAESTKYISKTFQWLCVALTVTIRCLKRYCWWCNRQESQDTIFRSQIIIVCEGENHWFSRTLSAFFCDLSLWQQTSMCSPHVERLSLSFACYRHIVPYHFAHSQWKCRVQFPFVLFVRAVIVCTDMCVMRDEARALEILPLPWHRGRPRLRIDAWRLCTTRNRSSTKQQQQCGPWCPWDWGRNKCMCSHHDNRNICRFLPRMHFFWGWQQTVDASVRSWIYDNFGFDPIHVPKPTVCIRLLLGPHSVAHHVRFKFIAWKIMLLGIVCEAPPTCSLNAIRHTAINVQ